jgi:gas vesicle protein
MGQDPSQIRQDIETTREQMGNTVEALGHKTDVTGRAKEAVSDKVGTLRSKVSAATPDNGDVKQGARRAAGIAQENPLGLGIAAVAAGFLAGLLVPTTRMEDAKIGPVADQVKDKAKETGQEALERGKQVAEQATETAKEAGREQAEQLKDSAQARAQEARNG